MQHNRWKTERWFVSPWNFEAEVVEDLDFPQRILVHDITLRDGEQQAGIEMNRGEKIRIAEMLAEVGVHRIEAGMPAVSPEDEAAIREIVRRELGPEIFVLSRCMIDDVKRAVDCGVHGVMLEIPSSEHIIRKAYRWPLERAIELSIQATRYAHEQGLYVVFFPVDSTRAELNWYLDLIERVANEGHMDALALVDTFGVCSPQAVRYLTKRVKERINKPLEAHFHNDFGLGVANTIAALSAGAEVMHTTVLGIGERAGNVSFEEAALALLTLYGIDLGLRYEKLVPLAQMVHEYAGQAVPSNKPIAGDRIFDIESGIIAAWYRNCGPSDAVELFPFRWDVVGQEPARVVLGKGSGLDSVQIWLEEMGISASETESREILARVKERSLQKKGLLSREDFDEIVRRTISSPKAETQKNQERRKSQ